MGYDYTARGMAHDPKTNGLIYLDEYPIKEAHHMMTSPEWTRAIFIREPKERVLSVYLEKSRLVYKNGTSSSFISRLCCVTPACANVTRTFRGLLLVSHKCKDPHWNPVSRRMESRYWPFVDYVGHMNNVGGDAMALLKQIGAWEEYGASGWGSFQNESIFASTGTVKYTTGAHDKLRQYYTPETEQMVENLYAQDYYNSPLFGFDLGESRLFGTTPAPPLSAGD